ncbi:PEP-CTERM sorting domain-containing protein [Nostoc sp. ChiQUE01b]|uniref:PEP-CTERM sorting domain-containing protein n=1 Tax=Nostoc sp. ChiQUE01b TaxID=3075376 RepID=UPI002AD4F088|nr:PEP-CTERM sorting domain-containing protein [Nostoc sp. ChiQUE01b]MDZ8263046.1 PEP-CTERM sorting domain-containing protein [Nostoc sp. ChiQUE01b]
MDIDDYGITSALEISNARLERVPEPTTILGLLTVLGCGATIGAVKKKMST